MLSDKEGGTLADAYPRHWGRWVWMFGGLTGAGINRKLKQSVNKTKRRQTKGLQLFHLFSDRAGVLFLGTPAPRAYLWFHGHTSHSGVHLSYRNSKTVPVPK